MRGPWATIWRFGWSKLVLVVPGALFGALRRRHINGFIPGAVLAFTLFAVSYGRLVWWNEPHGFWHYGAILAGSSAQALLVGAKKRNFLDLPLDFRIVVAIAIGVFLRGAAQVASALIR